MNAGVWLSARMTRASSSETSGSPPACYPWSIQYAFPTQRDLNMTNSNDRGDVTAYDHVRDGSVDMDTHWPVFVDENLFEKDSF